MLIKIQDLFKKYNLNIKGILHIGAHKCEELNDYLSVGVSNNDIIWIEGNEDLCNKIKLERPDIKIIEAIISESDGIMVDFIITNNYESSSILELEEHKKEHPHVVEIKRRKVPTITVDSILKKNGFVHGFVPSFVNIDIQGAELLALKGMTQTLNNVDYLYLEVNTKHLYKDCALVSEIDIYLKKYNFERVETYMTQHGWGDAFYIKNNKLNENIKILYDIGANIGLYTDANLNQYDKCILVEANPKM